MDETKLPNRKKQKFSENDVRNNSDNKDDVEVPVRMESEWNEVSSRHSASSSGNIKVNQPVNPGTIITSNRYGPLTSLTDTNERVGNSIEPGKQVIDNERLSKKVIPTIINGVVYSRELNQSVKCGSDGVRKAQPPKSGKSKVLILSDSYLRGCVVKINNNLATSFRTSGWVKPGAPTEEILNKANLDVVNMKMHDVIVLCAGVNDVYRNNAIVAYRNIINFVMKNNNTNIVIIGVPHRHDLSEHSCVNVGLRSFNNKLKNITAIYSHVTLIEGPHERKYFTMHGQHYNRRGKTQIIKQVVSEITEITGKRKPDPIRLGWQNEAEQVDSTGSMNPLEVKKGNKETRKEPQVIVDPCMETRQNHETRDSKLTNIVTNECIVGNDTLDGPINTSRIKRLRKTPSTRTNDFLW